MKRLAFILVLLLLAVPIPIKATSIAPPGLVAARPAEVDQRVLADTANDQWGRFLVIMREQADMRRVAALAENRQAQGQLATTTLRQTAEAGQPRVTAQLDALGARYRPYWVVNAIAVEGNRAIVDALAAHPDVKAIEADRTFRVPLEQPADFSPTATSAIEWGVSKINAPALWSLGYTGQNIVYANADTGVQWDHPALKPQYRGWDGATADHNYNWWDAIHAELMTGDSNPCGLSSAIPCDDWGHGTHTLGTGVGDDGAGNQIGVAPGAKWIACRNMEDGVGRPSTYIECLQFFLAPTDLAGNNPDPARRADIISNSYGCPPTELCAADSLRAAVDNVRAAGVFFAVSAGNAGPLCATVKDPPGLDDSSISVGAVSISNGIASFSSRGPVTIDGSNRRKPDLVAPGVGVRSSYRSNIYTELSGTSMAAPHVAGAVALLWSAFPHLRGEVDRTEAILARTAQPLTTTDGCGGDTPTQVPNNTFGYGLIDVLAAYNHAQPDLFMPVILRGASTP